MGDLALLAGRGRHSVGGAEPDADCEEAKDEWTWGLTKDWTNEDGRTAGPPRPRAPVPRRRQQCRCRAPLARLAVGTGGDPWAWA